MVSTEARAVPSSSRQSTTHLGPEGLGSGDALRHDEPEVLRGAARAVARPGSRGAVAAPERLGEGRERPSDASEDDVDAERVALRLVAGDPAQVDAQAERDERPHPRDVLGLHLAEDLVAAPHEDAACGRVDREALVRVVAVADEPPERALVRADADELRRDGEARRLGLDGEARGLERLGEDRLGAHPAPLAGKAQPVPRLGRDAARARLGLGEGRAAACPVSPAVPRRCERRGRLGDDGLGDDGVGDDGIADGGRGGRLASGVVAGEIGVGVETRIVAPVAGGAVVGAVGGAVVEPERVGRLGVLVLG